jgi:monoamine oxidase
MPAHPAHPARSDVIVIGGGLAGLSAARLLKRRGASVMLLEARSRLGGRAETLRIDTGHAIDLGPQFIGDSQRRISALVDECGLTRVRPHDAGDHLYIDDHQSSPVRFSGDALPLPLLNQLDALLCRFRLKRRLAEFPADLAHWDATPASSLVRDLALTDKTAGFLRSYVEGELCVPLEEISAYELMQQLASIGGPQGEAGSAQWFLTEGTQPLAQHLGAELGSSVVLDAPVQRIEPKDGYVAVETPRGTLSAGQLVVAVPPQLYGRMGLLPWLPPRTAQVVKDYRAGNVVKTLLVFASPWWRTRGASGRVQNPQGPINSTVDASPADGSVGLLVLFATAGSGRRFAAVESEAARIECAIDWLRTLGLGPVPPLLAARSVDWNADPWSLGGYASRRGPRGWVDAPDLHAPNGPIHFAGTETATEWRSFMEGALQSAERAAEDVMRRVRG